MKMLSLLLCAGLVIVGGFSAAHAGGREHGHGMKHEKEQRLGPVFQQLGLSEEQQAQLEALRTEFFKQQKALHEQIKAGALSKEEGRAQLQAGAEAHRTALDGILTEEQRQQLAELKQNHREDHGKGRRGPGMMGKGMGRGKGGPDMGRMAEALGLSDVQKAQWQELAAQQRAKMEELRQSGQNPDPEAMRQLFADHMKALEALLTPEQLQKWEEQKKSWKGRHPAPPASATEPAAGAATKPAAPAEESWGKIKSEGK
jgi:Spy/CpxP family protein refolding chaperone